MKLSKYFKVWFRTAILSLQGQFVNKGASLIYILAKIVRFCIFITLLYITIGKTRTLAGYDLRQMIIFFLVFNLIDIFSQLFFRGIYWFRRQVVSGSFDLLLLKPINPLFYALTSRTDLLDLPLLLIVGFFLVKQIQNITVLNLLNFILIIICSLIISTAIHILVACVGVITTEVDHTIWIYRDLSLLARVPVDIYLPMVRAILTYIVPIALIFTFPAKALMGLLPWRLAFFTLFASFIFFLGSIKIWQWSLKKYSSASS